MARSLYRFPCPCCGKRIEFDVRTGSARAEDPVEGQGGTDLSALLEQQQAERRKSKDAFDRARSEEEGRRRKFDEMFDRAKEEAKDDDSRPPSPFDLE